MIISIRGTHGSGKSTIIKSLLNEYHAKEIVDSTTDKVLGYEFNISWLDRPIRVIGAYKTACGGCDAVQPYGLIWPRINDYAQTSHVLFEGALISSSYGNIGRSSEIYGDEMVFAFLDTPVETCIARLVQRRTARGETKPLNPSNTISKHKNVVRSIGVIRDQWKRRVVILNHKKPITQILGLLRTGK